MSGRKKPARTEEGAAPKRTNGRRSHGVTGSGKLMVKDVAATLRRHNLNHYNSYMAGQTRRYAFFRSLIRCRGRSCGHLARKGCAPN